ncbi:MAG: GAF domain-containing protein, partial [Anaerolineae bacterium]
SKMLAHEMVEERFYDHVARHLHDLFDYPHIRVYEVQDGGEVQILRAFVGLPPMPEQYRLVAGSGGYVRIPSTVTRDYIPDVTRYSHVYRWLEKGSRVTLPLRLEGECIALLMIAHPETNAFDEEAFALLDVVSNLLETSLGRIHALKKNRQRADELLALQATMRDILAERELSSLLQAILQRAIDLLAADGGALGLFETETGETRVVSAIGLTKDYTGVRLQLGEGAMGWVAQHRKPLFVRDYPAWHNRSEQYNVPAGTQVLAAPLETSEKFIGAIAIVGRRFRESDLELLQLFAQQASLAVENARLYQDAVLSAEKRRALYEASQDIVSTISSPEKVWRAVHRAAERVMPAEAFTITIVNQNTRKFEPVYVVDRGQRFSPAPFPLEHGLSGRVLRTGQPVRIDNVYSFEL